MAFIVIFFLNTITWQDNMRATGGSGGRTKAWLDVLPANPNLVARHLVDVQAMRCR